MGKVLEEFDGYVTRMDEDFTYITFESKLNGDKFYGQIPTPDAHAKGIEEDDGIWIKTIEKEDGTGDVEYGRIPPRELTQEEIDEITRKIEAVFGKDDPGVLY